MITDIIINTIAAETRIALTEEGQLAELWVERQADELMVGDIYKGRVEKVLPGLQAAFVDVGTGKSGFLSLSDTAFDPADFDDEENIASRRNRRIEQVLKNGQDIMVQISKEPIANKGPRLTSFVSLAGRFGVLVPNEQGIGVSRKIESHEERRRLKAEYGKILPKGFGVVVRTAAEGEEAKTFQREVKLLSASWQEIKKNYQKARAPAKVHSEPPLVIKLLRELAAYDIGSIVVDDQRIHQMVQDYLRKMEPELRKKLLHYREDIPIFDAYGIEPQIEKAMERRVWLKAGGQITIDQTEALVAIDVNSGKFVGKRDPEQTVFKVNMQAAREIARQLRLRDIGGIIVIDFIDMEHRSHRQQVLEELKAALKDDRSRPKVYELSPLGLVEMSRKRVRPSLWHASSEACPTCQGTGRVISALSMAIRLERWLTQAGERLKRKKVQVAVHPTLRDYLRGEGAQILDNVRKKFKMEVFLKTDPDLPVGRFQVYDMERGQELTADVSNG